MPERQYRRIREHLKTGDLALFSGKSGFSRSIKLFTRSRWSHVGMILRLPPYEAPLVWESLRVPVLPDVEDGTLKSGVQLLDLDERIHTCGDEIAIRVLNRPVTAEMEAALHAFREQVRDAPYEQRLWELVRAAWDGPLGLNEEDLTSVFCSELVAEAYQVMGLLPPNEEGGLPSNEYVPAYFCHSRRLDLVGPWELSAPIVVNAG